MADWARRSKLWNHNLIALGDFNIDRRGDPRWEAFTYTGLSAPEDLNQIPRTIFHKKGKPDKNKFYDQIAWFKKKGRIPKLSIPYIQSGSFDFMPHMYRDKDFTKISTSYRISDHYPLWAEFSLQSDA